MMTFFWRQLLLIHLSIIALSTSCLFSQTYEWAIDIGYAPNGYGKGQAIKVDANGNSYVAGDFYRTVDFDPGLGTALLGANGTLGASDCFIAKYDTQGNYIWAIKLGGDYTEHANSIDIDASGNIYITGTFSGSTDFDPGPGVAQLPFTPTASWDAFIAKYDSNGNYVWAKSLTGGDQTSSFSLSLDNANNFYITGSYNFTVDFDPDAGVSNLTSTTGDWNFFLAKYDSSGNYKWGKSMGGNSCCFQAANCVNADFAGNVHITGYFSGTVDFDPGAGVANLIVPAADGNSNHIFIARYDSSGNYKWAIGIGAYGDNKGLSLHADTIGNVYTTGQFEDTVDFDPGIGVANVITTGNSPSLFVAKHDFQGNYIWAKGFNSKGAVGKSLSLSTSGNLYITGSFLDTLDFDPSSNTSYLTSSFTASNPDANTFIAKYDTACTYVWAFNISGGTPSAQNTSLSIDIDASDNIFVTGWFSGTADFDPSTTTANVTAMSSSNYDIYVAKYSSQVTGVGNDLQITNSLHIFPNPGNKMLNIELNGNTAKLKVRLFDLLGKNYQLEIIQNKDKVVIDTETLAIGVYIVEIEDVTTKTLTRAIWIKNK